MVRTYVTEAEEIKKRWQEYQKNCTEKVQITMMVIHLEPDIPECEVKWALGGITMSLVEVVDF